MLSSLPKLADKAFIIGFFIPTLLFVLVITALFYDQPWAKAVLGAASEDKGWDKLAYFVLAVWVLSLLLMMINLVQLQILEGYRWPVSKIDCFKQAEESRFNLRNARFAALNEEWSSLGEKFPTDSLKKLAELRRDLLKEFPTDPNDLLPTRLGNALRAFEGYPREVYGADSIPLWLHLSTVVPEGFQAAVEDARAQVNCAVNISVLAAIVSPVALVRFFWIVDWNKYFSAQNAYHAIVEMFGWASIASLLAAIIAAAISRFAYLFSIEIAYTWGDLVKAAFDCYLPALAEKLGYKLPETGERRRAFWKAISEQAIYWTPIQPEQWAPPEKTTPPNADANALNEIKKLLTSIFR